MEINRSAPATAAGELRIDADPQTVFAMISAIDQWPSWNPDVKSCSIDSPSMRPIAGSPQGRRVSVGSPAEPASSAAQTVTARV
jgi:hypothetical protein